MPRHRSRRSRPNPWSPTPMTPSYAAIRWASSAWFTCSKAPALRSRCTRPTASNRPWAAVQAFSYLRSHGELDKEHVGDLATSSRRFDAPRPIATAVIRCARGIFWLYGNMFRGLDAAMQCSSPDARRGCALEARAHARPAHWRQRRHWPCARDRTAWRGAPRCCSSAGTSARWRSSLADLGGAIGAAESLPPISPTDRGTADGCRPGGDLAAATRSSTTRVSASSACSTT